MESFNRKNMKISLLTLTFFVILVSCSDATDKPKNLLDSKTMSEMIADFAINEQLGLMNQDGNMEISSKYILKKHHVKGQDFSDSYAYYLSKPRELQRILKKAQKIIKEKDPNAAEYIDKKEKSDKNGPSDTGRPGMTH